MVAVKVPTGMLAGEEPLNADGTRDRKGTRASQAGQKRAAGRPPTGQLAKLGSEINSRPRLGMKWNKDDEVVVEKDAELVERKVVSSWQHFFLLNFFLIICTYVMYLFVKGFIWGYGPIPVDAKKIIDHPCRFGDPVKDKPTRVRVRASLSS